MATLCAIFPKKSSVGFAPRPPHFLVTKWCEICAPNKNTGWNLLTECDKFRIFFLESCDFGTFSHKSAWYDKVPWIYFCCQLLIICQKYLLGYIVHRL
jgi:hypothetical protein